MRSAELDTGLVSFDYEQYELPIMDFLETTDFETAGPKEGSWERGGVTTAYARIHAEDLERIKSETEEEGEFRMRDYWGYWKTIHLLTDPDFRSYLKDCMAEFGLRGATEDISPRMWQYVLREVSLDFQIPELDDAKGSTIPLELRLIER